MNSQKYLIAFDMDGTLLDDKDKKILPLTKQYLKKLNKDGHIIVLASGRPKSELMPYYNELELHSPLVCFNGIYCFNPKDDDFPIIKTTFNKSFAIEIAHKLCPTYCDNIFVESNDKIWMIKHDQELIDLMWPHGIHRDIIYGNFNDTINEDPMTLILYKINDINYLNEVLKPYKTSALRLWYGSQFGEIIFNQTSKATCLEHIRKYCNINKENTIAFGDYSNDIEMLNWAFHSVAMNNAIEDVKKVAKYITKNDNNNEGIVETLKEIIN